MSESRYNAARATAWRALDFSPMFLSVLHTFRYRPNFAARLAIVLMTLLYTCMASATALSSSHNPAAWVGHGNAALEAAQAGNHDHQHDAFDEKSSKAEHAHDHHTADHSHEPPALPPCNAHAALKSSDCWDAVHQTLPYPSPCFPFERPPRHLLAL